MEVAHCNSLLSLAAPRSGLLGLLSWFEVWCSSHGRAGLAAGALPGSGTKTLFGPPSVAKTPSSVRRTVVWPRIPRGAKLSSLPLPVSFVRVCCVCLVCVVLVALVRLTSRSAKPKGSTSGGSAQSFAFQRERTELHHLQASVHCQGQYGAVRSRRFFTQSLPVRRMRGVSKLGRLRVVG